MVVLTAGFSDPYCRFRLGNEKYKSKACKETLSPYWKEQFDMKFWDDTPMMLEVTVWDKDIRKDEFMGRSVPIFSQGELQPILCKHWFRLFTFP